MNGIQEYSLVMRALNDFERECVQCGADAHKRQWHNFMPDKKAAVLQAVETEIRMRVAAALRLHDALKIEGAPTLTERA